LAGAVGRALGGDAPCLDVRAGGAAALYAWLVAARLLVADGASALVVAAEATSAWLDPRDSAHALLYGDGAGAVLLRRVPGDAGLLGAVARNAAVGGRPFTVPGPLPPTAEALAAGAYRVQAPDAAYAAGLLGERERVLRELRAAHPAACASARALVSNAVTRAQAEHEAAAFGVEPAAVHTTLALHGALGCAAPLVALDELRGAAPAAETFALTAVGGGVAAAALVWRSTAGRETPAR
jgi:3-oxoacyl-[acyl-carrier-protein] synthase-3